MYSGVVVAQLLLYSMALVVKETKKQNCAMEHHCNAVTHLQATDEMCYRRTQTALYTSGSQCMAQKVFKITG